MTGEEESHQEMKNKPSLFSHASSRANLLLTGESEQSVTENTRKSLFKLATQSKGIAPLSKFQQNRKPLSIVNDTKEITNSLDSPAKPSSPILKSQFASDYQQQSKDDEVISVKSLASPTNKEKKRFCHSPSKFFRPGSVSRKQNPSDGSFSSDEDDQLSGQSQNSEGREESALLQQLEPK